MDEFGDELLIVDGGACAVGIESTIVDCSRAAPVLLRPGCASTDTDAMRCRATGSASPCLQTNSKRLFSTMLRRPGWSLNLRIESRKQPLLQP